MFSSLAVLLFFQFSACKGCQENQIIDQGKLQDTAGLGFTNDWGKWLDMAVTRDGSPAVVYYDSTQGGIGLAIGTISGSEVSWTHQEIDGYPNEQGLDEGDRGLYASLEIDANDTIWVAYYDSGLQNLRYATKTAEATEWTRAVADAGSGGTPNAGLYTDLTLDADGQPIIVHYDEFKRDLRVAHWNGSSFSPEIVDEGEDASIDDGTTIDDNTGKFASIAIDNGVEYIAYYDEAAGDLKLAWGTPSNYTIETVDSEGNVGQWTSIYIYDSTIYISYHDLSNDQLKLASGRPGSFNLEAVDQGEAIGADSELLVNASGVYIAYHDGYNNDIKLAARSSGDVWNTSTLAGTSTGLGFHNELVEINGVIYAACYNYTDENVWFSPLQ